MHTHMHAYTHTHKLSSIPSLEGVQASDQYEPPAAVASAGATGGGGTSATKAPSATATQVSNVNES